MTDRNNDLIGQTFDTTNGPVTVTGQTCWSPEYVNVAGEDGYESVRRAELVRITLAAQQ